MGTLPALDDKQLLYEALITLGVKLSDEVLEQEVYFIDLLLAKNEVVNLTAIRNKEDALILHTVDALTLLRIDTFKTSKGLKICDLGTGGGIPGIPLALAHAGSYTLVDSVGKKITAVNEFAHELGLHDVEGIHSRFEELPHRVSGFDVCVSRAVDKLSVVLEYMRPLLSAGGYAYILKASPDDTEYADADRVANLLGYTFMGCDEFELPYGYGQRSIFCYRVTTKSKIKLPRRNGEAKHKPL